MDVRCPGRRRRRTACRAQSGHRRCRRTGCATGRRETRSPLTDAGEGIRRVEAAVAIELEQAAREPVGARLGHGVHRRPRVHAVLRGEAGRRDAEFLQRIGERQRQVGVVLRVVVHGAVEQVGDAEGQAAGHRHVDGSPEAAAVRAAGVDGRAHHHEQRCHLPSLQRQFDDPLTFHDLADARAPHVHERRGRFNGHRFLEGADRQLHVDRRRGGDLQDDARLDVGAEPLERHFEPVWAGGQIRHEVRALTVSDDAARRARVGLGYCHRGSGQRGAAGIGHLAGELGGGNLRERRSGQNKTEGADGEHPQDARHRDCLSCVE